MERDPHPDIVLVPPVQAILSIYQMTDAQLLARRNALLAELLRALTPEERTYVIDVLNVVYVAGSRDGMKAAGSSIGPQA